MKTLRRIIMLLLVLSAASRAADRPNILWIASENNAANPPRMKQNSYTTTASMNSKACAVA